MSRVYCDENGESHHGGDSNIGEDSSHHDDQSSVGHDVIDIRGDQFDGNEKADVNILNLKYTDLWALGLTTAIGSHYFSWSYGLTAGFGSFIVALGFMSTAYFCLILCISELSSALPFAGGAYGIARVTLGIYPGFLIACYDSYKSILCVASASYSVGRIITSATKGNIEMQPLYWVLFYLYILAINGRGGVAFWRVNKIASAVSVLLLFVFIFGSIKFADFEENAPLSGQSGMDQWFNGGMKQFMHMLPTTTRFFVGIQSIDLTCGQIKSPKTEVPRGSMGAVTTVMFTSFAVVCVASSLPPGLSTLAHQVNPLTQGYASMFAISTEHALLISLPATVTYGMGYMYFTGKQLSAMGRSGLLPFFVGNEIPVRNTPVTAHVVSAVLGLAVCFVLYYEEKSKVELNNVVILSAMATYLSIFVSFVFFRLYFPTIKREFASPLGVYGAVYGALVFTLCFISVSGYQDTFYAIDTFAVTTVLISIYYYFVVAKRQVFSEEEKTVMFKAYLMKNNMAKSSRLKRRATHHQLGAGLKVAIHGQHSHDSNLGHKPDDTATSVSQSLTRRTPTHLRALQDRSGANTTNNSISIQSTDYLHEDNHTTAVVKNTNSNNTTHTAGPGSALTDYKNVSYVSLFDVEEGVEELPEVPKEEWSINL